MRNEHWKLLLGSTAFRSIEERQCHFYRMDSTKLSFMEYWRWRPGLRFLPLALKKVLGIRMNLGHTHLRPEGILRIPAEDLREPHRSVLVSRVGTSQDLGFEVLSYFCLPTVGSLTASGAALMHEDRLSILQISHIAFKKTSATIPPTFIFFSCAKDGRILATRGGNPPLEAGVPPDIQICRVPHGTIRQTWKRHTKRIRAEKHELVPFRAEAVADWLLQRIQMKFDYNLSRGVYVLVGDFESAPANAGKI